MPGCEIVNLLICQRLGNHAYRLILACVDAVVFELLHKVNSRLSLQKNKQ